MAKMTIPKMTALACVAVLACVWAGFIQGCETDEKNSVCYAGDQIACTCSNGQTGLQTCNATGSGHDACSCNEASSSSSSGMGGAGGAGGAGNAGGAGSGQGGGGGQGGNAALLPFMAECTTSAQCESMLCFQYNTGASLCSKKCTTDNDCPAPSPGCNNMGICKKP
jgi:hypothetical protein